VYKFQIFISILRRGIRGLSATSMISLYIIRYSSLQVEFFRTFESKSISMEIQQLPDHKAYRSEIDKYLDEPLLEYVWTVAKTHS
jgi:hypothetical protein